MILVINISKENLHFLEFVRPITDILDQAKKKYSVKDYKKIKEIDLNSADKIIICGTSLMDNEFLNDIEKFYWIKDIAKPVLGICGGMQIMGIVFNGKIKRCSEIGYYNEYFKDKYLGLIEKCEVYHLHNNYIDFTELPMFKVFCGKDVSQAVKHKEKNIYGVLFHPEVRNKEVIINFVNL